MEALAHLVECKGISPDTLVTSPRLLLIDDDEDFGRLMQAIAITQGVKLDYFPSLLALGRIGRIAEYDVAILDYYLGEMSGLEVAEYVERFFGGKPVIIVSGTWYSDIGWKNCPQCVRQFIPKVRGANPILTCALELAKSRQRGKL